jgi:hypothetical protein
LVDLAGNQVIDDSVKNFGMAKNFGFLYIFIKPKLVYAKAETGL